MYQVECALTHTNTARGRNPQARALFFRLAHFLSLPANKTFVFDGLDRPEIKRGTRVFTNGHRLTAQFKALIEVFGYQWYTVRYFLTT